MVGDASSVAPAATASASAVTAAVAAAPAAAPLALARFVDGQRTAAEVVAMKVADGAVGVLRAPHLHEAEASGTAGVSVGDEFDLCDRSPVLGEELTNLLLVRAEGKIADIQSGTHALELLSLPHGSLKLGPDLRPDPTGRKRRRSASSGCGTSNFRFRSVDCGQDLAKGYSPRPRSASPLTGPLGSPFARAEATVGVDELALHFRGQGRIGDGPNMLDGSAERLEEGLAGRAIFHMALHLGARRKVELPVEVLR